MDSGIQRKDVKLTILLIVLCTLGAIISLIVNVTPEGLIIVGAVIFAIVFGSWMGRWPKKK